MTKEQAMKMLKGGGNGDTSREEVQFLRSWLESTATTISIEAAEDPVYIDGLHKRGYGWFSNAADAMERVLELPMYGEEKEPIEEEG